MSFSTHIAILRLIMYRSHALTRSTHPSPVRRGSRQSGFTLVELLIVIAIVVLLMSILGVATMSMIGSSRVMATKGTMVKIQGLLQQRLDGLARRDPDGPLVDSLVPRFGNRRRAEAMARKFTFRQVFPQTWAQVPPVLLTGLPASPSIPLATPARPQESAEVLHFILTRANIPGFPPVGEDTFSTSEVSDTDGNGWPEFIDSWGRPLRFYRWPTRLIRGAGYTPGPFTPTATARLLIPSLPTTDAELRRDSDDKYGMLKVDADWRPWRPINNPLTASQIADYEFGSTAGGTVFGNLGPFHTLETYSLPLIVSGGPDLDTGLYEPNDPDPAHFGYLCGFDPAAAPNTYDDISNYNIRSGGK